jgi:5'-nucleotidase
MIENLKNPRILISNDDGIDAPGIAILEAAARELSDDVWVVAPETQQSGVGHSLSLHAPIHYRQLSHQRFAVNGTPTDAVLVAVQEVMQDKLPDLMLSGVNRGSNLAEDVTYSGTIAAAMEATLLEIPAIAFSNTVQNDAVNWDVPKHYIAGIIRDLMALDWSADTLMNVNFPALALAEIKGIRPCAHGRRKLDDNLIRRTDPRGKPYVWIGGQRTQPLDDQPMSDYRQIMEGYITITPLNLDLTEYRMLEKMHAGLGS